MGAEEKGKLGSEMLLLTAAVILPSSSLAAASSSGLLSSLTPSQMFSTLSLSVATI
jgi:hypothetical protein